MLQQVFHFLQTQQIIGGSSGQKCRQNLKVKMLGPGVPGKPILPSLAGRSGKAGQARTRILETSVGRGRYHVIVKGWRMCANGESPRDQ